MKELLGGHDAGEFLVEGRQLHGVDDVGRIHPPVGAPAVERGGCVAGAGERGASTMVIPGCAV